DQPNHLKVRTTVRRPVAEAWEWMCPAHVYEVGRDVGDGMVNLEITPSNCVQCGAITAKGGRLTPPEGGSGPEYTLTYRCVLKARAIAMRSASVGCVPNASCARSGGAGSPRDV